MSTYDSYETVDRRPRSHRHRDRDRDRDDQYVETRETYVRGPAVPDPPYISSRTDLIRRPGREDSEMSVEEVRREFPPPGAGGYLSTRSADRYGGLQRSRSADRGDQHGAYADDRGGRRKIVREEIIEPRRRSLSRNQKILAAVGGAALAVGGKELWDRRQNHGHSPEKRNILASAAVGGLGAFAAYEGAEFAAKRFGKEQRRKESYTAVEDKNGRVAEYYSSGEEEKPKKSRRKSIVEGALGLAGLGAAAKSRDRDDRGEGRSRRGSGSSRDRSRGPGGGDGVAKFQQAAKAALLAGAAEAFRVRNEPGGWAGAKGKRILTAAIGAGGIDAAADRDPDHKSKRHILEAVVGGLAGNRLINGPRSNLEEDGNGRSRSRSRGPGGSGGAGAGLAALATAGLGALAGKKLLDRSRSRDRGDDDRRRRSISSEDDDRGDRRRKRSKSVSDYARKGLAALGIGGAAEAGHDERRRDIDDDSHSRRSHRRRDSPTDDYERPRGGSFAATRGDPYDDYNDSRSSRGNERRQRDGERNKKIAEGKKQTSSDSDLGSSSGDEKKVKKMKGKQFLTAGLATVATIHAAHNVYQSYEKRAARHKAVQEGKMSEEESRKLKSKARLQDAASIGIAVLGIKGAYSEWKEMKEVREEAIEFIEKKEERHQKRVERQKAIEGNGQRDRDRDRDRGRRAITDGDRAGSLRKGDPRYSSAPDLTYGRRYNTGSRYIDSNPYSATPGPPA